MSNVNALIKEWADAAGVQFINRSNGEYTTSTLSRYDLQQLITAAVAREREACAKICIDYANRLAGISHHDHPPADEAAGDCADEIRERSNAELPGAAGIRAE